MKRWFVYWILLLSSVSVQAKLWAFDVYMDAQKIGTHTFEYNQNTLKSQADFKVKILLFTAYEYHHTAIEHWQQNCLSSLNAKTTENDEVMEVNGEVTQGVFVVEQSEQKQMLPNCTMTFAYWNPAILQQAALLNPQNAEYLTVKVNPLGEKVIETGNKTVNAQGYELLGFLQQEQKLNIKIWYDANMDWVALQSTTPEGYLIDYKRQNK